MFDYVATHKRLILIVLLVLIIPPFAFFGIDSYFRGGETGQAVARIGDYQISQGEFSRALRERQDALQRLVQGRIDPDMLDNPELRYATLDALIQRRLLLESALRSGVVVGDERLQDIISRQELFQDEAGKFSLERYQQFLRSEGMTPVMFESRLRQDIILQQFADGFADTTIVPRPVVERLARLSAQKRELSQYVLVPQNFLARAKLEPDAAKQYYDANPVEFRLPEQVRVEFLTLSGEALQARIRVDPAEVRKFSDLNRRQFEVRESRQAAHIFVSADATTGAEARQKARARAEALDQQVRKAPGSFAELADSFNNTVYEQSDGLKPAAELIQATPQLSGWITRARAPEPLLNHPRLLAAVFSEEVLRGKRNTEAIEVAPATLVAARVVEHKPESVVAFDEVRVALENRLALRAASRLSVEEGRRLLAELNGGKSVQVAWSKPQLATRAEFKDIPEPVVRQAFRLDASRVPAYTSVENPQLGYTLVRVSAVQEAADLPPEKIDEIANSLRRILAQEAMTAHLASLKQKAGVTINKELLERKDR